METRASILVIDDDAATLDLLADALSPDYEVSLASDALQGMELLRGRHFDLMVLDLLMPVSGVEFIQELRSQPRFAHLPILVITTHHALVNLIAGILVDAVLPKPFSLDDLSRVVADAIERSKQGKDPTSSASAD